MSSSRASTGSDGKPTSPTKNLVLNDERRMLALNAAQMGTWLWDLESQSIHWDDQGRRLFGQPEGSTGASIEDFLALLHPDDRKPTREAIEDAVEKRSDYDMIHRMVWPDGSIHWLRCKGKVEPGVKCILGLTIEINWLKRAEELMRTNERLATEAALANALAHEINNPLEIICNVLYLLRRSNLDANQETLHAAASEAFQRIEHITRHMLTLHSAGEQTCRFKLAGSLARSSAVFQHGILQRTSKFKAASLFSG